MDKPIVEVKNAKKNKIGIVEWTTKCRIFEAVLAQSEFRSVCRLVLASKYKPDELRDVVISADDAARKWDKSKPERKWREKLLVPLLEHVGISDKVSVDVLINGTHTAIINALPIDKQDDARQAAASANSSGPSRSVEPEPPCIEPITRHTETALSMTTVEDGVRAGLVESYVYYSSVHGAKTWANIINGKRYTNYFYCMAALDELVDKTEWKKLIKATVPKSVYMLGGGGSHSKDWCILESIIKAMPDDDNSTIIMTLVDINLYMLQQSRVALAALARRSTIEDRIRIRFFEDDILNMGEPDIQRTQVLTRSGPAVFTLFGSTIGNISEARFFSMLRRVAHSGDILVVGCGVLNGKSNNEVLAAEVSKYKDQEVLELISPGVDWAIRKNKLGMTIDGGKRRVEVEVLDEQSMPLSDVHGSCNVALTLNSGGKKVVLLRSARYEEGAFVQYAAAQKWILITSVSSAMNADYKQIVFQKE